MLQNPIYTGVRQRGDIQTNRFIHLQIIEDKLFLMAQSRLERSKLEAPIGDTKYRENVLLSEHLFCMHCGKRMTVTRNIKTRIKKDGSKVTYHRLKYICINKSTLHPCDGQRSYSAELIDATVLKLLQTALFSESSSVTAPDTSSARLQHEKLVQEIAQEQISLETLKAEVVQVLQGTSAFGSVLIRDLIQRSESRLMTLNQELLAVQEEQRSSKAQWGRISELRKTLIKTNVSKLNTLPLHQQREIANPTTSCFL